MPRLLIYGLKVALVILAAVWLVEHPGAVTLDWLGWRIDTSVAVLIAATVALAIVVIILDRVLGGLGRLPRRLRDRRGTRRLTAGLDALTQGFARLAVGDAARAGRAAIRAGRLLENSVLPDLLRAEAARRSGGDAGAQSAWADVATRDGGTLIAAHALAEAAVRAGDLATARTELARAQRIDPSAPGVLRLGHELDLRTGRWADALESLRAIARARLMDGTGLARRTAIVWLGRAREAESERRMGDAAEHARKAWKTLPAFLPAAIESARLDQAIGKTSRAGQTIEATWAACAHPDLAESYRMAVPRADALTQVKRFQLLVELAPRAAESHLALADASRAARLWGEARRHYEMAISLDPAATRRATLGLAQVAASEPPITSIDPAAPSSVAGGEIALAPPRLAGPDPTLLAQLATAPAERGWRCGHCGTPHVRWEPICPACHSIDTIDWRLPPALMEPVPAAGMAIEAVLLPPTGR